MLKETLVKLLDCPRAVSRARSLLAYLPDRSRRALRGALPADMLATLNQSCLKSSCALLMTVISAASCADETPFTPGRPGNTESPSAVAAGHWQVESELVSYARARDQRVGTDTWQAAATSFRVGVAPATDAEIILRPYARSDGPHDHSEGFGDITLRARHTVLDAEAGPTLALIVYVTAPTAQDNLGARSTEGGLIVTGAWTLSSRWSATLTAGAADASLDSGGHGAEVYGGLNVGYAFNDRWGSYGEAFVDKAARSSPTLVMQSGVTLQVTPTTQLDAGVEPGLNHAADAWRVFAGWAHRF